MAILLLCASSRPFVWPETDPESRHSLTSARSSYRQTDWLLIFRDLYKRGAAARTVTSTIDRDCPATMPCRSQRMVWRAGPRRSPASSYTRRAADTWLGVVHLLSLLTGAPMDSTMVAGVYGSLLGADVLKSLGRRTSIGE